ncbi:MAG TPA: hypothetical protein VFZ66_13205 [Herpetosiphonaceae bacterium]
MKRIGQSLLALVLVLSAIWAVPSATAQRQKPGESQHHGGQHAREARPHGDPVVRQGLITATAAVTAQKPRQVRAQLEAGKSIEQIALTAGKSAADVLARFDAGVDRALRRAVDSGRLPQSVANARAAWFKQAARLQIDQPGLQPAFPGLHELHVMMISAAVRVSGMRRVDIRAQLESCKTLSAIVATRGKSGADVARDALAQADRTLMQWVSEGKLTTAQRDEWHAALQAAMSNMVSTSGLHVAGKECAT